MLYHRICAVIAVLLLVCICSCSGSTATLSVPADNNKPAESFSATDPVYRSTHGLNLYQLDDHGALWNPGKPEITVTESATEDGIEWVLSDASGEPRPILFRVEYKDSGLFIADVSSGDWGGEADTMLFPATTKDNDLDAGLILLGEQDVAAEDCLGKTFAKIFFTNDIGKQASYSPPQQKAPWHGIFPFENPDPDGSYPTASYDPVWPDHDNHVEGYAKPSDFYANPTPAQIDQAKRVNRNKLSTLAASDISPYVLNVDYTDDTVTLKYAFQLHGDYNRDGQVNISDITMIGRYWYNPNHTPPITTDYNAVLSSYLPDPLPNPFRANPTATASDPQNFADGSMNGYVHVPLFEDDDGGFRHVTYKKPSSYTELENDDFYPIHLHYGEAIGEFEIEFENNSDDEVFDKEIEYVRPATSQSDLVIYTHQENLRTATVKSGMYDGTYNVHITTFEYSGVGTTTGTKTTINDAFTITGHPKVIVYEQNPPIWTILGNGLVDARPYVESYRSIWLKWATATTNDVGDFIDHYKVYVKVQPQTTGTPYTAAEVLSDPDYTTAFTADYDSDTGSQDPYQIEIVERPAEADTAQWGSKPPWAPGARVSVVVTAVDSVGNETLPPSTAVEVKETYLSYDYSPPEWITGNWEKENPNPGTATIPRNYAQDLLCVQYGVAPAGAILGTSSSTPGYMIYYGYAQDEDTGVIGYKAYYTENSSLGNDARFTGTEWEDSTMNSISTMDFGDNAIHEMMLYKRFIFIPASSVNSDIWVCIHAINGEGDESLNNVAHNIKTLADEYSSFQRLTISDNLDVDFDTGDMAYQGWDGTVSDKLFIANANTSSVLNNPTDWSPNIDGWYYDGAGHPLEIQSWQQPNLGSRFYVTEPIRSRTDGVQNSQESTLGLASRAELSVEFAVGPNATIGYQSLGTIYTDQVVGQDRRGYINQTGVSLGGVSPSWSVSYTRSQQYDMWSSITPSEYLALPTDLAHGMIGLSYPWQDMTNQLGYIVHGPTVGNSNVSTLTRELHLLGDEIKSGLLATGSLENDFCMMETCNPYLGYFDTGLPLIPTIWGIRNDGALNGRSLYLYWHNYDMLYSASLYNNQITPNYPVLTGPYSWSVIGQPVPMEVSGTGYGLPASLTYRGSHAYVLYNSAIAFGGNGLGYVVSDGPGNSVQKSNLSNFPRLIWHNIETTSRPSPRLFRDILDVNFGASILNQRSEFLCAFPSISDENSWANFEDAVSNDTLPEWATEESPPLAFVFIQAAPNSTDDDISGIELWYGEIYNIDESGSKDEAFVFFELVDSVDISNYDLGMDPNNTTVISDYRPIWCALGMNSGGGISDLDRTVPVIGYGVKVTDNDPSLGIGLVKVASIVHQFNTPAQHFKYLRDAMGNWQIWLYESDPEDGTTYGSSSTTGVTSTGQSVTTGVWDSDSTV